MRYSQLFAKTSKNIPKDEVAVNAKYLLQGGFIDKLMAGSYSLLPLGRLVERKIEQIIREEMNATGAQEVLMPLLHPKDVWNETGRWDTAKDVMYQFEKNDKEYALSFTHEEIVMDLIRKHVTSYKDLPVKIYHFSTKFRNELRAKSGILRGREFLMKDLYSAHVSEEDMYEYYWKVADAYRKAFTRIGLTTHIAEASGGVFTDKHTHEFQVLAPSGEDTIYFADDWEYAKNDEVMTDEDKKRTDLRTETSIEVGNIFPLGTFYSEKMGATFTDQDGTKKPLWFASYGIGPTRVMGTVVEVSHDDRGIIWPESIAPFAVHLIGLNGKGEDVYQQLQEQGIEVLFDDRQDRGAGEKFGDADLIGIPFRAVVSDKSGDKIEIKKRDNTDSKLVEREELVNTLKS
ncbi:MAG TPA: His/Gly/Thr/Pro-type tRNA ligase C-terminal domain-containing protein [Candidatus Levybacteria bacterium]|nr:His/Gly/Thr/Pro-type tRNA ligase C-terminal domain-containing protein [Candidatus Levybacteria bacterium]